MKNKTADTSLTQFLERMVKLRANCGKVPDYFYQGMEDFVLRAGKPYKIDHAVLNKYGVRTPKQCFNNAFDLVLENPDELRYVEGYAAGVIPTLHAWTVDHSGVIFDPTWTERQDPWGYYGVEIPISTVIQVMDKTKHYGVIDAWEAKWPLLKNEYKPNWEGVELI